MRVKRILIIGNPGAGKSTLAMQLGLIMNLPVIHLDKYFWQKGWVAMESEKWRDNVREMVSRKEWIIDGNFDGSLDVRLPRADAVIFLDFPTHVCLWRVSKRIMTSFGKVRQDMAEGCPERIDFPFLRWVWRFRRDVRPEVAAALRQYYNGQRLYKLDSPRMVNNFLGRLADGRDGNPEN
ncbi:MAG: AAA family ATPase [FCB group bacterium]|nr:AAA family ATPase [FCB group bacterium]